MEDIDKRIGRILGQLRGIQKMAKEERDCVEILQQVSAVKKAIDGLSKEIVYLHIDQIMDPEQAQKIKKTLERAISL